MEHFKSLSYDGFGINGRDEFRSRIATFAAGLSEEQRREFGPLFAAAPQMLRALEAIVSSSPINGLPLALEIDIQNACAAIRSARGAK